MSVFVLIINGFVDKPFPPFVSLGLILQEESCIPNKGLKLEIQLGLLVKCKFGYLCTTLI